MSYSSLVVVAPSVHEAVAYAVVLAARGIPAKIDGERISLQLGTRAVGAAAICGLFRWALEARINPRLEIDSGGHVDGYAPLVISDDDMRDCVQPYGGPAKSPVMRMLIDGVASLADSLDATRAKIDAMCMMLGDSAAAVRIGDTPKCAADLEYSLRQLIDERDQLQAEKDELVGKIADADQVKAELRDLRSMCRGTWMPAKSRRKLSSLVPLI